MIHGTKLGQEKGNRWTREGEQKDDERDRPPVQSCRPLERTR